MASDGTRLPEWQKIRYREPPDIPLRETLIFHAHIKHYFCPTYASATFGMAPDKQGQPTVAVNLRCLEGIDLAAVERKPFDGKRL